MSIYKNTITLKGFLGANAVEHTSSNQKPIVVLSLATKSSYKDKRSSEFVSRADWHRPVAVGRLAESARSLTKGAYVEVEGQLQSREYVLGETKRRVSEVRARSITKLERTPRSAAENLDAEPVQDEVPA
ncbi:MAG: single-stranded DNA-binding protein [Terriglobales bacterium]